MGIEPDAPTTTKESIMQPDLHHPLVTDFPEYREAIHELKLHDAHFRRLFDEYHEVDREVVRIDEEIEPASDARTDALKQRRVHLKDELLAQIRKVAAARSARQAGLA
jgi:uncharacterized protein